MLANEIWLVVLIGTFSVVLMIVAIIVFVIRYNNRFLKLEIKKQRQLLEAEINSKETERSRIAREIHDAMSSNLAAINLLIQKISSKFSHNEILVAELGKMKEAVEETHESIRRVAKDLLAHDIDVFGLKHAVNEMLYHSGLLESNLTVNSKGNEDGMAVHKKAALYRIIQEILSNAILHSHCKIFAIDIDYQDENLNLRIEFDGTIFDFEDEMKNSEGLGLRNIESRVRYLNGNLKYHNTDIRNFYIISVPKDAKY